MAPDAYNSYMATRSHEKYFIGLLFYASCMFMVWSSVVPQVSHDHAEMRDSLAMVLHLPYPPPVIFTFDSLNNHHQECLLLFQLRFQIASNLPTHHRLTPSVCVCVCIRAFFYTFPTNKNDNKMRKPGRQAALSKPIIVSNKQVRVCELQKL